MAHKCELPRKALFDQLFQCTVCGQLWAFFGFWAKIS